MNSKPPQGSRRHYQIRLIGVLDEDFSGVYCPAGSSAVFDGAFTTLSGVVTDQAGMVGLIRHLHNLGYTIVALGCEPEII